MSIAQIKKAYDKGVKAQQKVERKRLRADRKATKSANKAAKKDAKVATERKQAPAKKQATMTSVLLAAQKLRNKK